MGEVTFRPFPESMQRVPGGQNSVIYTKIPLHSMDWGADWEHPTSLDFEKTVIDASVVGEAFYVGDEPVPPDLFVVMLRDLWEHVRGHMHEHGYVVDRGYPQGLRLVPLPGLSGTHVWVRLKVWPAIEGVTTPRKDRTW